MSTKSNAFQGQPENQCAEVSLHSTLRSVIYINYHMHKSVGLVGRAPVCSTAVLRLTSNISSIALAIQIPHWLAGQPQAASDHTNCLKHPPQELVVGIEQSSYAFFLRMCKDKNRLSDGDDKECSPWTHEWT